MDAGVHVWFVWVRLGWRELAAVRVLEQVLLHPRDDVARLVERFTVDEQAGNLALSADGTKGWGSIFRVRARGLSGSSKPTVFIPAS